MESTLMQIPSSLKAKLFNYFIVQNHAEAKKSGCTNACCMFCDQVLSFWQQALQKP
jgi:hypothetical protein